MPVPRVKTASEPIEEVQKVTTITNPVGQKNVAGTQVNPATEDTLALVRTAVEIIDNFISGARGLVTEDNSAAILAQLNVALSTRATEATLAKLMPTTATKYAVALTLANTEYSQALPANTKKFRIHLRDYAEFRFAYGTGKVATPTDPYETIPAGSEKYEDGLNLAALTVYLASPVADKTAEIEAWS